MFCYQIPSWSTAYGPPSSGPVPFKPLILVAVQRASSAAVLIKSLDNGTVVPTNARLESNVTYLKLYLMYECVRCEQVPVPVAGDRVGRRARVGPASSKGQHPGMVTKERHRVRLRGMVTKERQRLRLRGAVTKGATVSNKVRGN